MHVQDVSLGMQARFRSVPFRGMLYLHILVSVIAIPILIWGNPRDTFRRLLLRCAVVVLLLFVMPWRWVLIACGMPAAALSRLLFIVGRVGYLFPPALCFVILLAQLFLYHQGNYDKLSKYVFFRRLSGKVAIAAVLALGLFPSAVRLRMMVFEYGRQVHPRFYELYEGKPDDVLMALRGRVVLSDAWTSYMTQFPLQTHVVTVPEGHSSGFVDVGARSARIRDLFAGKLTGGETVQLLAEWKVEYVLVNRILASGRRIRNFDAAVVEYESVDIASIRDFRMLSLVYEDDDILLFQVIQ